MTAGTFFVNDLSALGIEPLRILECLFHRGLLSVFTASRSCYPLRVDGVSGGSAHPMSLKFVVHDLPSAVSKVWVSVNHVVLGVATVGAIAEVFAGFPR